MKNVLYLVFSVLLDVLGVPKLIENFKKRRARNKAEKRIKDKDEQGAINDLNDYLYR